MKSLLILIDILPVSNAILCNGNGSGQGKEKNKGNEKTKKRRDERDNIDPHRELYNTVPVNFIYL